MTHEEINRRIAKLCGWTTTANNDLVKDGQYYRKISLPYTESLDACREFEVFDTQSEFLLYIDHLIDVCDYILFVQFTATPLQRCVAFLRMKGHWPVTEPPPGPGQSQPFAAMVTVSILPPLPM